MLRYITKFSSKYEFWRMMSFVKPRKWSYLFGLIGVTSSQSAMGIIMAIIMKDMVDAAVQGNSKLLMKAILTSIVSLLSISLVVPFLNYTFGKCVRQILLDIRKSIFKQIEELPMAYHENNHSGDLISRITNDVNLLEYSFTAHIRRIVFIIISGISSTVTMLILDWRIALILIVFGVIASYVTALYAKPMRRVNDKLRILQATIVEKLGDMLGGFNVIKMFNIRDLIMKDYYDINEETTRLSIKGGAISGAIQGTNFLFAWINYGGIIALGSFMVYKGMMTLGVLMAITRLVRDVTRVFLDLGTIITDMQSALSGAHRLFELIDEKLEPEKYLIEGIPGSAAMVELEDIVFGYEESKNVLEGLSIKVEKGQLAALVGSSGGGKSTVIKLLLGFYPPRSGKLTLDGKGLGQYTLGELRDMMAYVPQDAYLFDGTIEENIRYSKPDASREDLIEAAKAANAHDFIMEQQNGYETIVGERGVKLSGGQKQRIAIARALLKNAPILLLDEATSSLDSESERLVQEALNTLMQGRTVIAVAHRLSTIEHADVIYVIDGGKVVEQGTHDDLTSDRGLYNRLYELQFRHEEVAAATEA